MLTLDAECKFAISNGLKLSAYPSDAQVRKVLMNGRIESNAPVKCKTKPTTPLSIGIKYSRSKAENNCIHRVSNYVEKTETATTHGISKTSENGKSPSSVPGNLRGSRGNSATQILPEFFCSDSSSSGDDTVDEENESSQDANINIKEKINISSSPKTVKGFSSSCSPPKQATGPAKSIAVNLYPELAMRAKLSLVSKYDGGPAPLTALSKQLTPHSKNRCSSLNVNLNPYSRKTSIPKKKHAFSPSNFPAAKYRLKYSDGVCKRSSCTVEQLNMRKSDSKSEHINLKKASHSKKQSSALLDNDHVLPSMPLASSPQDQIKKFESAPPMKDFKKARKSLHEQLQKLEIKCMRNEHTERDLFKAKRLSVSDAKCELKKKQRQEIYALNKEMTVLENGRFVQFMQNSGLLYNRPGSSNKYRTHHFPGSVTHQMQTISPAINSVKIRT